MLYSRAVFTAAFLALATPVFGQPYPTIVGEWYAEDGSSDDCGGPYAVQIKPMMYAEETYVCRFDDVARNGWTVTWNGTCGDGTTRAKTHVVAREDSGRLSLWFNGNPGWSKLRRCGVQTSAAPVPGSEHVPLIYTAHAAETDIARQYWHDAIDMVADFNPPPVVPVTVQVASAGGYDFAFISGGMVCGMGNHGCPIRVFQAGEQLGEFSACEDLDRHSLAADGSRFFGCENDVAMASFTGE